MCVDSADGWFFVGSLGQQQDFSDLFMVFMFFMVMCCLLSVGCAEARITPWMVCSRATQEQLPSASFDVHIFDALRASAHPT